MYFTQFKCIMKSYIHFDGLNLNIGERGNKMKLNADIIFDGLKENYSVSLKGQKSMALHLSRPQFYMDGEVNFLSDHLYLATADHLPQRPNIQKNVVLVCIGESIRLPYYQEHCTVIAIKGNRDFFSVYQSIQEIYNRYDRWNDELFELFKQDADIQKIVDASYAIFQRPIFVLDSNFHYIAVSNLGNEDVSSRWDSSNETISQSSMKQFLELGELSTDIHEPIFLDLKVSKSLCINLFDRKDTYIGCLCLDCNRSDYHPGDDALAAYLGRIVEKSLEHNPLLLSSDQNTMKHILKELISDMPISPNQRWLLNANRLRAHYVCISMHVLTPYSQMPASYICNIFEENFQNSFAFPSGSTVVGFIDLENLYDNKGDYHARLNDKLVPMLDAMKLIAGISNDFTDLYDAKLHYKQAEAAIENGVVVSPQLQYHYFSSYVLMEMVMNSLGGLPVETYYPKGLRELIRHDDNSGVSYLETLKVFLNKKMSYTAASKSLYVHRSTLIDRIARIERDLGIDLEDPDERLQLQLLLKAMEIEEKINRDL